jgi:acyl-CoA thioesterase-1
MQIARLTMRREAWRRVTTRIALFGLCAIGTGTAASLRADDRDRGDRTRSGTGEKQAVVFFGDSLTAGYGLDDPADAFPAVIAGRIAEAGLPFEVVNAGLSGETTAAGVRRVGWVMQRPVAVFVLALGGNDGLRGIPVDESERNLCAIIDAVRRTQPDARIVLAGIEAPPNMGPDFTNAFRDIFPRVAHERELPLVPFLLEGVGGEPSLNLRDGIHPNPAGQKIVAENVWLVLEKVLRDVASTRAGT